MMKTLVLASASPRRKQLLEEAKISFVLFPVKVSETLRKNLSIDDQIISIAEEKAVEALRLYKPADSHGFLILSADTEVILDGEALGKPLDQGHACRLLRRLSGRSHEVKTAIVLIENSGTSFRQQAGKILRRIETTKIFFRDLSEREISEYVAGGEPMDKAGAYGIQGLGRKFVERIEGPFDNVVGLPIGLLREMLREL
jgi:septum formation protein